MVTMDPRCKGLVEDEQCTDCVEDQQSTDLAENPQCTGFAENPQRSNLAENPQGSNIAEFPQNSNIAENPQCTDFAENPQCIDFAEDQQCADCLEDQQSTVSKPFICGSCWGTFDIPCKLHAHIEAHSLGGSYYYNHRLKVAYPKYDTVCSETQTDVFSFETDFPKEQDSKQNQKSETHRFRGQFCKLGRIQASMRMKANAMKKSRDDSDMTVTTAIEINPDIAKTSPSTILTRSMRKRKPASDESQTELDPVTAPKIKIEPKMFQNVIWKPTTHLIVKLPSTNVGVARQPATTQQLTVCTEAGKRARIFFGSTGPKDNVPGSAHDTPCIVPDSSSANPTISVAPKKTLPATLPSHKTISRKNSKSVDVDMQEMVEVKVEKDELEQSEDEGIEFSTNHVDKAPTVASFNEATVGAMSTFIAKTGENSTSDVRDNKVRKDVQRDVERVSTLGAIDKLFRNDALTDEVVVTKLGERDAKVKKRVGVPIGLAKGYRTPEYILKRERKRVEKIKAKRKRIKVTLANHPDKYFKEEYVSNAMRDRGKSNEEKTSVLMVCALCKTYKTTKITSLEIHLENHLNGDFKCKECGVEFERIWERDKHRHESHSYMKREGFKCPECLIFFYKNQRKINEHMANVHGKKGFVCKFCSMVLASKDVLQEHSIKHHKGKLTICPKCNDYFSSKCFYRIHRETCGKHKRKIPCQICGKQIASAGLYMHVRRVHENERKFNCKLCSYSAFNAKRLLDHVRAKHTGERMFKCDDCDFTCVTGCQLKSHRRTHTKETPFKCDQCSYAAAWNVQLKDHKKLHGLPSSVTCDECGVLVKNVKCLNLHTRKEHSHYKT